MGVTGSGKTFTVANVIEKIQKPTLVLSHNKTLAAQLYEELQQFFPNNKVCYFVSYYDYYQPESYLPHNDMYIEKDADVNEVIERLRLETATSLMSRKDVIVVSSVSCIYAFGHPAEFADASVRISIGQRMERQSLLRTLIGMQYERNETDIRSGRFRVQGGIIDIVPGGSTDVVIRVELGDDAVIRLAEINRVTGSHVRDIENAWIFPAKPFVIPQVKIKNAIKTIREELRVRLPQLGPLEAYRLQQRTNYDLEMIEQLGYCKGVENYSRHFDGREPGTPPFTLLDFFNYIDKDWLLVVDESHVTIPQVGGMYEGDRSRKQNLIDYGFRLPSAYDNRPLQFKEFEKYLKNVIYVSATPGEYEYQHSQQVVEQIIRPTGLIDPPIAVRPSTGQVDDAITEISRVISAGHRILITTLTKQMAEDLSLHLLQKNIKAKYLHSDIDTLERTKILRDLRLGEFDVLVGVNLLREGLDLPEVALVLIFDADKEGFLRNTRSLIQTIGRAARNVDSQVIMYADKVTDSMRRAIDETNRRRTIQLAYNEKHGITPMSIVKAIAAQEIVIEPGEQGEELRIDTVLLDLEQQMAVAAEELDFEKAIALRDRIALLKKQIQKK